jgi:eukaryotic-like serine/threonine-protein kinase
MASESPPEKLGPYRIGRRLGKGGMGSVYLAEHEKTAEIVAVKTLDVLDAGLIHALRLEINSLARLHHPGVVKVRQSGVHDGVPWCAMELLDGVPLSQHLNQVRAPEPESDERQDDDSVPWLSQLSQVLGIAVDWESLDPFDSMHGYEAIDGLTVRKRRLLGWLGQVCRALGYVHGEGVLHCDLKPANILVTERGRAILLDFGLAVEHGVRLSAEQLENAGMRAGTAHYMAPEIIRGLDYDARADLYAIGCLLYQAVTGVVPFAGRRAREVYKKHLEHKPLPLSAHGLHVPEELEDLIMRLLSKEPMERPGHAAAIVHVLNEFGIDTGAVPAPPARPYLFRPRLVGRGPLVGNLATRLGEARGGQGGIVVLAGGGGVGKTALAAEAVRRSRRLRMMVMTGQCQWVVKRGLTSPSALPLQGWTRILRRLADNCRAGGEAVTRRLLGDRGGTLALCAPFLRELPGFHEEEEAPRAVDPMQARRRLYRALVETASLMSRGQPMLFVIEDLQWADQLTIDSLRYLNEEIRTRPWLLLATCRTDEDHEHVQPLLDQEETAVIRVPRLDGGEVGELLGEMLGRRDVPEALSSFIADRSAGNPFFAGEHLRLMMDLTILQRSDAGEWQVDGLDPEKLEALPLPRSIRGVVEGRLESLDAAEASVVRAAAVLGRECRLDILAQVAGLESEVLYELLASLDRRDILEAAGRDQIRFVHDRIREAAYASTDAEIQRGLHGRAAQSLHDHAAGTRLGELAIHWHHAGALGRARETYTLAARQALGRHAREEAEGFYQTAIELYEDDPRALSLQLELVEGLLLVGGRHDEAHALLSKVVRDAHERRSRGEEAKGRALLGRLLGQTGRPEEASKQLDRALEIYRRVGDAQGQGAVLMALALRHIALGEISEGRERLEESLEQHRAIGDLMGEALILYHLGVCQAHLGAAEAARGLFDTSMSIYSALGNRSGIALALAGRGWMDQLCGRRAEAWRRYEEAITRARELGYRELEARTLAHAGRISLEGGRFPEAWERFEQGLAVAEDISSIALQCANLLGLGDVAYAHGDLTEANRSFREALELSRSVGDRLRLTDAQLGLAATALAAGELARARMYVEEALEMAGGAGLRAQESRGRFVLARLELAGGAVDLARDAANAGLEWAHEVNDPRAQALGLLCLASVAGKAQDFDAWSRALEACEALSEGAGDAHLSAMVAAQRAHYRVCAGELADEPLALARRSLLDLECSADSQLGQLLAIVDLALEAQDTWLL